MSNQESKKSKKRMCIALLATSIIGVSILGAGCALGAGKGEQKTYPVENGTVLKIYHKNGDIDISSWDREEIQLEAVRHSSLLGVFVKEPKIDVVTGKEFIIRTVYSSSASESFRIQYRIKVPKKVLVKEVESSNGNINVENVSGDVNAKTSTGGIHINKVNGFVKAVSSNGKINITGVEGLSGALTESGDISVEAPAIRDNLDINSSSGSITVFLSPDISAQLEAGTSSGTIAYENLPLSISQSSKTKITGKLGDGGNQKINIKTSSGSIKLKRLK